MYTQYFILCTSLNYSLQIFSVLRSQGLRADSALLVLNLTVWMSLSLPSLFPSTSSLPSPSLLPACEGPEVVNGLWFSLWEESTWGAMGLVWAGWSRALPRGGWRWAGAQTQLGVEVGQAGLSRSLPTLSSALLPGLSLKWAGVTGEGAC